MLGGSQEEDRSTLRAADPLSFVRASAQDACKLALYSIRGRIVKEELPLDRRHLFDAPLEFCLRVVLDKLDAERLSCVPVKIQLAVKAVSVPSAFKDLLFRRSFRQVRVHPLSLAPWSPTAPALF